MLKHALVFFSVNCLACLLLVTLGPDFLLRVPLNPLLGDRLIFQCYNIPEWIYTLALLCVTDSVLQEMVVNT